jgi:hypothetical protein
MISIFIGMTGMTLRVGVPHNQGVILNLFQDLSAHSEFWCFLCLLPKVALYPPTAFDTPNHIIANFKVFFGATQAAAFDRLNPRLWW